MFYPEVNLNDVLGKDFTFKVDTQKINHVG